MKTNLLFELNNVIVSLENNNRFSEANILNREFVKIAQDTLEQEEVAELKFRLDLSARMVSELIFAIDDIAGSLIKISGNPSLGVLKSLGLAMKQIANASKALKNPAFIKNIAVGMKNIPKNILANQSLLSKIKLGAGIVFQFFQIYFLVKQISQLLKDTNSKTLSDANSRSKYFGQLLGMLSTFVSIGASVMGPAAPALHGLALGLQGTGLLLEFAPEVAEKVYDYLENITPEVKENVSLSEQGIPSCNRMTLQWAKDKVKNYSGNTLELFNDLMENHYQEIIKPGPKTALISSIVKNPKYKSINQQYMAEMFGIIKCGYGIQAL
jgi:hypothetical protein